MSQRIPQNETAEQAALCLLAYSPHRLLDEPWREELFLHPAHQLLFRTIEECHTAGLSTELIPLTSTLEDKGRLEEAGGPGLVTNVLMTFGCANPLQTTYYLEHLEECLILRKTLTAAQVGLQELREKLITPSELADRIALAATPYAPPSRPSLDSQLDALSAELANPEPPEAFATGLPSVDNHLRGGFHRRDFGVVAGGTSMGKSVLLTMAALQAARAGQSTVFFSLEMPASDILRRLAANLSGQPVYGEADRDRVSVPQLEKTAQAIRALRPLPLQIYDDVYALVDLEREIRRLARLGQADLVLVDYLQLVEHTSTEKREQAVSEISRRLKNLAGLLKIAIVTASQVNEEGKVRESRAIGHHADVLLFLEEDEMTVGKIRRNARDVTFPIHLRGAISRFEEPGLRVPVLTITQGTLTTI